MHAITCILYPSFRLESTSDIAWITYLATQAYTSMYKCYKLTVMKKQLLGLHMYYASYLYFSKFN